MKTPTPPLHTPAPEHDQGPRNPADTELLELFFPVRAQPIAKGILADLAIRLRRAWHAFRGISADRPSHALTRHLAERGYLLVRITPHYVRDGQQWYQDANLKAIRHALGEHPWSPTHHVTLLWPGDERPAPGTEFTGGTVLRNASALARQHLCTPENTAHPGEDAVTQYRREHYLSNFPPTPE